MYMAGYSHPVRRTRFGQKFWALVDINLMMYMCRMRRPAVKVSVNEYEKIA